MDNQQSPQQSWIVQIATKYFSVWIWSIVIGITTSTSLSLVNYFPRARGAFLVLLLAPLLALSGICVLASWFVAIRFLDRYLLPIFFGDGRDFRVDFDAARLLSRAVRFSLLALAFRVLLSVADLILSSTSSSF